MHAAIGSGVTPHAAAILRRWGRIWIGLVVAAMFGFTLVRLATGGARLHDWESVVWPAALLALALGGVVALRFEGFGGGGALCQLGAFWLVLHCCRFFRQWRTCRRRGSGRFRGLVFFF